MFIYNFSKPLTFNVIHDLYLILWFNLDIYNIFYVLYHDILNYTNIKYRIVFNMSFTDGILTIYM